MMCFKPATLGKGGSLVSTAAVPGYPARSSISRLVRLNCPWALLHTRDTIVPSKVHLRNLFASPVRGPPRRCILPSAFIATSGARKETMPVKYMTADELAALIKSPTTPDKPKDFLVVDVRDDDFAGGNIVGALNHPSSKFMLTVHDLVEKTRKEGHKKVVFHCALSQVRGPKAARIYEETRKNLYPDEADDVEVVVLRNGFQGFQAQFKDDPVLVENWEESYWNGEWA
ncbi:hypothetical protein NMY22_g15045 [Coprinellus aureogranulatus]|nr:hypothetical protein NMY22_g15045 [Coprinellus aureogranulatus]